MRLPVSAAVERRRPFAAAPAGLSALAMTVAAGPVSFDLEAEARLVRAARAAGVTTFDTVDSANPALAEAAIARAFPQGDPEVVVLSPPADRRGPPALPIGGVGPRFAGHGAAAAVGTAGLRHLVEGESGPPGAPGPGRTIDIVRCRSPEEVHRAVEVAAATAVAGPFSLLEPHLPAAAGTAFESGRCVWVARDPFAGGRLDGRRFAPARPGERSSAPRSLTELSGEFAPVARLAFLVRPHERTLAQAALRFVLEEPWVATVCLPPPPPDRWTEILGYASSPPLTADDRARLAAAIASGPAPAPRPGAAP